uniref:Uncharacterized protein n=1 Tax=Arundo donax TaxID=35708 RepID=A0A0A9G8Q4_ARUDO
MPVAAAAWATDPNHDVPMNLFVSFCLELIQRSSNGCLSSKRGDNRAGEIIAQITWFGIK